MCSEVNTGIVQSTSSRRTTTKFSTVLHVLVLELYRQIYLQVVPLCNSIYKSNKITIWGWLIRGSISKVIVPGKVLQGTGTCTKNIHFSLSTFRTHDEKKPLWAVCDHVERWLARSLSSRIPQYCNSWCYLNSNTTNCLSKEINGYSEVHGIHCYCYFPNLGQSEIISS